MSPHLTSIHQSDAPDPAALQREVERLERRCDELAQQVLETRDAVVGAEAELGAARARVVELEHHVHIRDVELEELRAHVASRAAGSGVVGTGVATGERLARGVARRVRSRI
ncbi:MAG: hypothetical protein AAFO29_02530 [Actinomycetota bacterium]